MKGDFEQRPEGGKGVNPEDIWWEQSRQRELGQKTASSWEDETYLEIKCRSRAACKCSRGLVTEVLRGGGGDHGLRVLGSLQRGQTELTTVVERVYVCREEAGRVGRETK